MNRRAKIDELNAFATIAAHASFRKASDELGVAPSTLSHMMRTLERTVGVRLLNRTTRSVALTEAGERLLARLRPLIDGFEQALDEVSTFSDHLSGTLRINASEHAARILLQAQVKTFLERHPSVSIDLVTDGRLVDIVAESFDAGIRLGDAVPQDMIAVRIGGPVRFITVASPSYLANRQSPRTPDDLKNHRCIRIRFPSGKPYRWEFSKRGRAQSVEVSGPMTLDHAGLMAEAAVDGMGIAYVMDQVAKPYLDSGKLIAVLDDWCPQIDGLHLYYSGHRYVPPALKAFIAMLQEVP